MPVLAPSRRADRRTEDSTRLSAQACGIAGMFWTSTSGPRSFTCGVYSSDRGQPIEHFLGLSIRDVSQHLISRDLWVAVKRPRRWLTWVPSHLPLTLWCASQVCSGFHGPWACPEFLMPIAPVKLGFHQPHFHGLLCSQHAGVMVPMRLQGSSRRGGEEA